MKVLHLKIQGREGWNSDLFVPDRTDVLALHLDSQVEGSLLPSSWFASARVVLSTAVPSLTLQDVLVLSSGDQNRRLRHQGFHFSSCHLITA